LRLSAHARYLIRACLCLAALALAGCTLGASAPKSGGAELTVTRDFGGKTLVRAREDPIRAIVIAAVAGAVLMGLLSRITRSGARAVERRVRR